VRPQAVAGLEIRLVGDELLVHDPAAKKIHVLNQSAGEVLKLCDGTRESGDIVARLCEQTGADAQIVGADVDRIIDQFQQLGLIVDGLT